MIVIRPCKGLEELQACVDLQIETWGYCDGDVIPRRAFLVAQKIGGQVIGAFDVDGQEDEGSAASMVGFAFSLPGVKTHAAGEQDAAGSEPQSYLHSHMLAVRESFRNQSIGAQLKLAQRREALGRGIQLIEWTFDPLEIKNAFLNIHKLGAIIRRYEPDFYGVSSSRLQGGLPTDRLVAEWWLASPAVQTAVEGNRRSSPGRPGEDYSETIRVPAAIYDWKADENQRHLAEKVQAENRSSFQKAFSAGLTVVEFSRNEWGDGIYYLA